MFTFIKVICLLMAAVCLNLWKVSYLFTYFSINFCLNQLFAYIPKFVHVRSLFTLSLVQLFVYNFQFVQLFWVINHFSIKCLNYYFSFLGFFGCQVNASVDILQLFEISKLCDGTPNCYLGSDESNKKLKCTSKL